MQTVIQATPEEFINLVRTAVREELKIISTNGQHNPERPFTKKEAAKHLNISLSTLERMIRGNELPVFNIGKRVFIKQQDMDLFLKSKG